MITLPPDWFRVGAPRDPETSLLAYGPITMCGFSPTVIVKRMPHIDEGREASVAAMLEGGRDDEPTHRVIDVGETSLAGYPASVVVITHCFENRHLTQMYYIITPEDMPTGYVLILVAATPDFGFMAGVFADIVASFQPEGF